MTMYSEPAMMEMVRRKTEQLERENSRLRAALIDIRIKGRTTGYGRGALAQIAGRALRDTNDAVQK